MNARAHARRAARVAQLRTATPLLLVLAGAVMLVFLPGPIGGIALGVGVGMLVSSPDRAYLEGFGDGLDAGSEVSDAVGGRGGVGGLREEPVAVVERPAAVPADDTQQPAAGTGDVVDLYDALGIPRSGRPTRPLLDADGNPVRLPSDGPRRTSFPPAAAGGARPLGAIAATRTPRRRKAGPGTGKSS